MVADIAHLALRQRRMRAGLHRRTVLRMDHPAADQAADLVVGFTSSPVNTPTTPGMACGRGVDRLDGGVRMRAAHEIGVGLPGTRLMSSVYGPCR
jgi:hypothetical protein